MRNDSDVRVRVGALQLLNSKLMQQPTPFTRTNVPQLVDIANILNTWIDDSSIDDELVLSSIELRQCATYSLKLIARVIGIYDRSPLIVTLDHCAHMVRFESQISVYQHFIDCQLETDGRCLSRQCSAMCCRNDRVC